MLRKIKIIFSFIILLIGLTLLCSEYFTSKKIQVYDYINEKYFSEHIVIDNEIFEELENEETEENEEEIVEVTSKKDQIIKENIVYIGYLTIPKVNLKKGFTSKESIYNTVSKNIQILSASDYPDKEKGNVIIAGHSGNTAASFFKQLYKLNVGDYAYIEYNGNVYTYKINNIYTVPKTGKVEIIRDKNKSTLTLITCTKDNRKTQTIYISELVNKE